MTTLLNEFGRPMERVAAPAPELHESRAAALSGRARGGYDAARDTAAYENHWANADALDADSCNSRAVRHKLMKRSRYEAGSNGYYDGTLTTYANSLVGVGPTLRMLTRNRSFNQYVELQWSRWAKAVQLRRKLWCMAHARVQDGEAFALLVNNPGVQHEVQLDLKLIEAEQVQTPYLPFISDGYIDGIKKDQYGNVEHYDVLPYHPGSTSYVSPNITPVHVGPRQMLHWFKLRRPGASRSVPACTSTLNVGASGRRWREAVLGSAEAIAEHTLFLKTTLQPELVQQVSPLSTIDIEKRMMTALPMGWDMFQPKAEQPSATHESFNRSLISEQARPLSMPYNAAACDSSTYSFASGKLDTLNFRDELDVERADCDDTALSPLFAEWFREWSMMGAFDGEPPAHRFDWPAHKVIDEVAHANAVDTKLRNGSTTLSRVYSDAGEDFEDALVQMTQDYFGNSSEENIGRMRQVLLKTHFPDAFASAEPNRETYEQAQPT